jgi:hypothetical protein
MVRRSRNRGLDEVRGRRVANVVVDIRVDGRVDGWASTQVAMYSGLISKLRASPAGADST